MRIWCHGLYKLRILIWWKSEENIWTRYYWEEPCRESKIENSNWLKSWNIMSAYYYLLHRLVFVPHEDVNLLFSRWGMLEKLRCMYENNFKVK